MALKNQFNSMTQQGSVAETALDDTDDNEAFDGLDQRRFFRLNYYITIVDPGLLNLGTLTLIVRWNDGVSNKTFSSIAIGLSVLGTFTSGQTIFSVERVNQPASVQPTFEIVQTSLVGNPTYQYNIYVEAIPPV